jgi:hypothetical protein
MRTKNHRAFALVLTLSISGVLLVAEGAAHADNTCISAYEQAQTLRKDGKPVAAKAQAVICAREACPALLTKDCNKWLAELEAASPTVILDPRAPSGGLRADVRVKLDGTLLTEKIDGRAIPIEPGSHTFVFEAEGATPAETTIVLREGEKNKKITATLSPPVAVQEKSRPIPLGVWVFGGATVVALATATVFGIQGLSKKSDLDDCKPHCSPSDVDSMSSTFTIADVALGAGVMAGAAALYLLLTRPEVASQAKEKETAVTKAVPYAAPLTARGTGLAGGVLGLSARF